MSITHVRLSRWSVLFIMGLKALVAQTPLGLGRSLSIGAVRGQVLDAQSGLPVRSASVTLSLLAPGDAAMAAAERQRVSAGPGLQPSQYSALSDSEGRYSFEIVAAGQYTLSATKTGYLETHYDVQNPFETGSILDVTSGRTLTGMIKILSPGAISGKVTDADGEPFDDGNVRLMSSVWVHGKLRHVVIASTRPNDLGDFRFGKLRPGTYFVAIAPAVHRDGETSSQASDTKRAVRTFHPAATALIEATPIEVRVGAESRSADIVVQQRATHTVKGRVVSEGVVNAAMSLAPADEDVMSLALGGSTIRPNGEFSFENVPPGLYKFTYLAAFAKGSTFVDTTISVNDADIDDLKIAVPLPVSIRGQVRVDSVASPVDLSNISISLVAAGPLVAPSCGARVLADGSFVIEACSPGDYVVTIKAPPELYVKLLASGSQELRDRLLTARGGSVPLDVVLKSGTAQIAGTIVGDSAGGSPLPSIGYYVLLPSARPLTGSGARFGNADSQGKFRITGLEPGKYRLFAFESPSLTAFDNPEVLKALESVGSEVELKDSDSAAVFLTLLTGQTAANIFEQDK
jgi:hypothetical protein